MSGEAAQFLLGDDSPVLAREEVLKREWADIRGMLAQEDLSIRRLVEDQLREQTSTFMNNQEHLLKLIVTEQTRSRERLRQLFEDVHHVDVCGVHSSSPVSLQPSANDCGTSSTASSSSDVAPQVPTVRHVERESAASAASAAMRKKGIIELAYRVTSEGFSSHAKTVQPRPWRNDPSGALKEGRGTRVVEGVVSQTAVCVVIVLYLIFVGIEVNSEMSDAIGRHDYRKQDVNTVVKKKDWMIVVGYCFTSLFILELGFRIVVLRSHFLLGEGSFGNMFDAVLVLTSVVDQWLQIDVWYLHNVSYLRCFRIFWVFRALRLAKTTVRTKFVRDFRMMMVALMSSVVPLFWAVTTLASLHYLASIIVMMFVADYITHASADDATVSELTVWFESLPMSVLTLFMAITGGVSWWEIMEPMLVVGHLAGVIFVCFIVVTVLAVLNIITSFFVNDAIEKARSDASLVLAREMEQNFEDRQQLKDLFGRLDVHRRGQISCDDFCEQVESKEVQAIFSLMGIEVADAQSLFRLLDVDENQSVERDEFVMGCMRFKSGSNGVSVECSLLEIKEMVSSCMKQIKRNDRPFYDMTCGAMVQDSFLAVST